MGNDRRRVAFIVIQFIIILCSYGYQGALVLGQISCILSYKSSFSILCFASNVGLDMICYYQERMLYVLYGFSTLSLA